MNFWPTTIVADLEAHSELRASETNCNEHSCKAAFLCVLDAVGATDFLLAHFLMTVCGGCALEVGSKVWQLPVQLNQLRQQPLHKIAQQPSHTSSNLWHFGLLHCAGLFLRWRFKLQSLRSLCSCSFVCCLPDRTTAVF